jgi:hypothetical protein
MPVSAEGQQEATALSDELRALFSGRWVCGVVRRGYHNGSGCGPSDEHGSWDCGWRWEASLSDAQAAALGISLGPKMGA